MMPGVSGNHNVSNLVALATNLLEKQSQLKRPHNQSVMRNLEVFSSAVKNMSRNQPISFSSVNFNEIAGVHNDTYLIIPHSNGQFRRVSNIATLSRDTPLLGYSPALKRLYEIAGQKSLSEILGAFKEEPAPKAPVQGQGQPAPAAQPAQQSTQAAPRRVVIDGEAVDVDVVALDEAESQFFLHGHTITEIASKSLKSEEHALPESSENDRNAENAAKQALHDAATKRTRMDQPRDTTASKAAARESEIQSEVASEMATEQRRTREKSEKKELEAVHERDRLAVERKLRDERRLNQDISYDKSKE